jgi:hypothetical protein
VFDWLFEGRTTVYVVLAALTLLLLALAWQTRKRHWLLGAGAVLALAAVYFLLSLIVETDRKQIEHKLQEMAAGVKDHDPDKVFAHVSEDFRLGGKDKAKFREFAEPHLRGSGDREVVVWDVRFPPESRSALRGGPGTGVLVEFRITPKGFDGRDGLSYPCDATFVRDPDRQWRLKSFRTPLPLPGLSP